MDFDSSSKFISSLAKFLQSLCNGYVEFDNGVEVIGHIYLSVDTGKKIDYVLNEKVCKTDENSVTFISNSFHAQPAEKPKPPPVKNKPNSEKGEDEDDIILMDEPASSNTGTVPSRDKLSQQTTKPQSAFNNSSSASKRPHSQSLSSNRPSKHRKTDSSSPSLHPNGAPSNHRTANEQSLSLPPNMSSSSTTPSESNRSHSSPAKRDNDNSNQEERDIKPVLDSDMNVVNVKQEYDVSAEAQDNSGIYNDQDDSYYDQSYDMSNDQYYGGRGAEYGEMGGGEMYPGGLGPESGASLMGDSVGQVNSHAMNVNVTMGKKYRYECELCGRKLFHKKHYIQHKNAVHYKTFPYSCPNCGKKFAYRESFLRHVKMTCRFNSNS